ncbi:MAG: DUF4347 domain-containing protein [Cyanobacteria bacterium P01_F01_bin.153]
MAQRIGFPLTQALNSQALSNQPFNSQRPNGQILNAQTLESPAIAQGPFQSLAQYLGQYLGQYSGRHSSEHSGYLAQPPSRSPKFKTPALPISMGHWFDREEKSQRPRRQVAFVDRTVDDHVLLLSGIPSSIPVILLDSRRDSFAQITRSLAQYPADTVHILTHGSPGALVFGSGTVNQAALTTQGNRLSRWFSEAAQNPTVVIYGCEVGAGNRGKTFLKQLGQLTGAAIAASSHPVGAAHLGGNWDLNVTVGEPRFDLAVSRMVRLQYNHVLAPPVLQSVSSVESNGVYSARTADNILSLTFTFDQSVNFTANGGALEATLNNGAIARLVADASGSTLTVDYSIGAADQSTADLSVTSLALVGGATLTNAGAEAANLTIPFATNLGNTRTLEIDNRSILAGDISVSPAGNVPLEGPTLTLDFGDRLQQTNGSALGTDLTNAGIISVRRVSDNATVPIQRVTFNNTTQRSITVVPEGTLDPSTTYRVEIAGNRLEDDGANEITSAITRDFVTQAGDVSPPRVNFVPDDGTTVTDPNSNLTIEFSEPIRIADNDRPFTNAAIAPVFTLAEFNSSGSPIAEVPFNGVYDEVARRVTLDPVPALNPGSTYRLELRGNVLEDFADNAISTRTINFVAAGDPVQFPTPQVTENSVTNTFSVAPLTEDETTITIAPRISPQTQVNLPVETNSNRSLSIDLENTVGNVALSGPSFQGSLSFTLPRPLSNQRGNLALDFSDLGGGDRSVSIRNRNFSGTLELNLPNNGENVALNFDDFEARTEVNLNGDQFTGDATVVVPLGLTNNPELRRRFTVRNFDGSGQVFIDGRRNGLAFEVDSETPIFGQLGAGGDIVRLTGAVDSNPGVSPLGLGGGGDFFEDRRLLSTALSINGNGGDDVIVGSVQNDRLNGGQGNDRLLGNGGNDLMGGDRGDDHLFGNRGDDQLNGGDGNDLLQGGRGNDTLTGGDGNDRLLGELGDDLLIGGSGQDQFVVMPGSGNDAITDFDPANDAIMLSGGLTPAAVQITAIDANNTRLVFDGGSVTLQNLAANTLNPTTLFS